MTTVKQVVIVGGSFSGLAVASELSSYPDKFAVTLIRVGIHVRHRRALAAAAGRLPARVATPVIRPSLHESIGGGREAESNLTTIDVKLFAGKKGDAHKVVLGRAVSLDGRAVVVQPRGGAAVRVDFDVLVVACGCAYAPPVRTAAEDSDRPERLREIQGWSERLGSAASILIVGGGAVGVELAGEVASRAAPPGGRRIVLATAASSLVVDLPVASRERAHKALAAMGVEVRFNCRAAPVGVAGASAPASFFFGAGSYALTSGGATEELEAEAAMFCFGGAPNTAWLKGSAVDLDAAGFVCRDACLQATGAEDVYVVGDCALKPDAQRLASFAHFEGEYLAAVLAARHSAAAAGASRPVSAPYTPPPRFVALSLGPRDGIFVYDSVAIPIPGFLVPYIKAAIKGWFVRLMPMPYAILSLLPGDKSARLWTKPARAPRAPAAVAAH